MSKPISVMRFVEAVGALLKEREEMPKVNSSAIDRVEYSDESGTLDIWYSGGDRYSYFDVPRDVYEALLAASSVGAFVNSEVKPHYRFEIEEGRRRFRPQT